LIPARKHRLFNAWFASHARGRIRATFGRTRVFGLARAREIVREAPVLVVSNHTSWWDPLVILHASQHLFDADGHALMDAKNLRKLPFFALVGAFGVDLDKPADGAAAIKYAARLLDRPGRLVWVFPQGRERPITERPLGFRPGAAEIARVARRARALPVALRYEFSGEERPELYISIGEPMAPERDTEKARAMHEQAVEVELDRIERVVRGEAIAGFEEVHRAPASRLGELATALLAFFTRHPQHLTLPVRGANPPDRS